MRLFRSHRPRPQPCRLRLEPLDERTVPSGFRQTNLVSNQAGVAGLQDPGLVNAWGMALNQAGGALWVSAHGADTSPLYLGDVNGSAVAKAAFTVAIPDGAPTGQVFNASSDFVITNGTQSARALFIFAGEDGTISGWNPAVPPLTQARVAVPSDGETRYTGLAIGAAAAGNRLYAADLENGEIDVFNGTFSPVDLGEDAFVDPRLPRHFAPFNVQNLNGTLYVTYARTDKGPDIDDLKGGIVSAFDLDGNFLRRVARQGSLDAPWGLAIAPEGFGNFGGALLVGNHGDGRISAFDPETGRFLGRLREEGSGRAVRIDGLFGLQFGNGVSFGDRNALYFSAGPDDGADGLVGSLRFVPDSLAQGRGSWAASTVAAAGLAQQPGTVATTSLAPPTPSAMPPTIDWTVLYLEAAVMPPAAPGESSTSEIADTPATTSTVEELHV